MKKIDDKKRFLVHGLKNYGIKSAKSLKNLKLQVKNLKKKWNRDIKGTNSLGGGEMSVLRGETFEKAGVNISTVFGPISDELKGKIPGSKNTKNFWASGISVVIHPYSPKFLLFI